MADVAEACTRCGDALAAVAVTDDLRIEAGGVHRSDGEALLFVCNPYADALRVRAEARDFDCELVLEPGATRRLPVDSGTILSVRVVRDDDETLVERVDVGVPMGTSLLTVGGSTLYGWQDSDAPPVLLAPARLIELPVRPASRVVVSSDARAGVHRSLLRVECPDGSACEVIALANAPVVAAVAESRPGGAHAHPDLDIVEITPPKALRGKPIQSFAASDEGIVALCDGIAWDYSTGARLHSPGPLLREVVLGPDGLLFLTTDARVATLRHGEIDVGSSVVDPTLHLWSAPSADSVYLFGGGFVDGLIELSAYGPVELLGDWRGVTAVGPAPSGILVALGRTIERVTPRGQRTVVLELPEGPPVVGLTEREGDLLFATPEAIYVATGDCVLPLATEIGGRLQSWCGGVLVHDERTRRLFFVDDLPSEGGPP